MILRINVEGAKKTIKIAEDNVEATKPRTYGHADTLMYGSQADKDLNVWCKAYARDMKAMVTVYEDMRKVFRWIVENNPHPGNIMAEAKRMMEYDSEWMESRDSSDS
jgi:hypothetical protein